MATSTTFKGAPKPYGASGHFDESRRHALQAKGFKTGHLSDGAVAPRYSQLIVKTHKSTDLDKILTRIPTPERRLTFLKQFNNLTENDKSFVITILRDTDEDNAIDLFDCNPYDPTKQDLKGFIEKASEKVTEGANWVGEKAGEGAEWVKERFEKVEPPQVGEAVYEQMGIENLEKGAVPEPVVNVPLTSAGLENVEVESREVGESQPAHETFTEKLQRYKREYDESRKREKILKSRRKKQKIYSQLGKEMPEDEGDEDTDEDYDPESAPAKFAHFLSNLSEDYSSEDLVGLNEKELEVLAVRFKSQNKDGGLFGDPENPFLEELKKRMEAKMTQMKIVDTTEYFCIYCGGNKDECLRWKGAKECPPMDENPDREYDED